MELKFEKSVLSCLERVVCEPQNQEQTQELRLSDGMPDVGRVLGCWGQPVMRSKEWRTDSVLFSGGVMAWVLYMPEDETVPCTMSTWLPFQMSWDLPDHAREGDIRIGCRLRFMDARSVSPRKLVVRAGMGVHCEAYVPAEKEISVPGNIPGDVELLRQNYLLKLPTEAGEKAFVIDEELAAAQSAPRPEKLIYYCLSPEITDQKVLGNKLAFRGNGNLHVLFSGEGSQLDSQDYLLPFSQFAELNQSYGSDAKGNVRLTPTNLELELDEEGTMHLKCVLTGQYLIDDSTPVETVADAYCPGRELRVDMEQMVLPARLDETRESVCLEQSVQGNIAHIADVAYLPDYPRQRRFGDRVQMEIPGTIQLLYRGEDNMLHGMTQKTDCSIEWRSDETAFVTAEPGRPTDPQISMTNGGVVIRQELPVELSAVSGQGIPMVIGMEIGERREPDPTRPSLILRRAAGESLWEIARDAGSTPALIQKANALEGEPNPGQFLLIPVS